jgi:hypothetical protein
MEISNSNPGQWTSRTSEANRVKPAVGVIFFTLFFILTNCEAINVPLTLQLMASFHLNFYVK